MSIKTLLWSLRQTLGLSPTQQIFRELKRRGVILSDLVALEAFGGTGRLQTKDYVSQVSSLDVWEIDPQNADPLRRNLPTANIKITDSYAELEQSPSRYSLITLDTPSFHGTHYEHFDLFPGVFRILEASSIIILNVLPGVRRHFFRRGPLLMSEEQLAGRRVFYRTRHPQYIAIGDMIEAYRTLIEAEGFELEWYFSRRRTLDGRLHYLVLKITKPYTNVD